MKSFIYVLPKRLKFCSSTLINDMWGQSDEKHTTFGPAYLQIFVNTLLLFKVIDIMSLTHECFY